MIDTPFDQKYWSVVFVLFWPMREIGTNRSNPFIFSIVFQIEHTRLQLTVGSKESTTKGATLASF